MTFLDQVRQLQLPARQFLIVGGGCLAVRGLRETKDLDIVVLPELFAALQAQGWPLDPAFEEKWNRKRLVRDNVEIYQDMLLERENKYFDVAELIRNADEIEGILFLPLPALRLFKLDTGREKDLRDVEMIDKYMLL